MKRKFLFETLLLFITFFNIFAEEDYLTKLKQIVEQNADGLIKDVQVEIKKLKSIEDFSVVTMIESSIIKKINESNISETKKYFVKKELDAYRNNLSLIKAASFLKKVTKILQEDAHPPEELIKAVNQMIKVVNSLRGVVIPISLNNPDPNSIKTPKLEDDDDTIDQYEKQSRYPNKNPSEAKINEWRGKGMSHRCNIENCGGCCINESCFTQEECHLNYISKVIDGIIIICVVCCCLCGAAIISMFYFNKKRIDIINGEKARKLAKEQCERNFTVEGIPVQASGQQGVVIAPNSRQGFSELAEEMVSKDSVNVEVSNI